MPTKDSDSLSRKTRSPWFRRVQSTHAGAQWQSSFNNESTMKNMAVLEGFSKQFWNCEKDLKNTVRIHKNAALSQVKGPSEP